MKRASAIVRAATAAMLALLIAVRLLSPAGFMPSFKHGSVAIVACPDGELTAAPMAHHHHGGAKKLHQPCPYAAGAGAGTLADAFALLAAVLLFGASLQLGRTLRFLERHRTGERPPLRGPPVPA